MTILIVEDSEFLVTIWKEMLRDLARSFREADNIPDALVQMRIDPHPDLILLDLTLKPKEGYTGTPKESILAVSEIKSINPNAVVLILTGSHDPSIPALVEAAGADGFSQKLEVDKQEKLLYAVKTAYLRSNAENADASPAFERRMRILENLNAVVTDLEAGGSAEA